MDKSSSSKVPSFTLRHARQSDHYFAERLYLETMKPLLKKLGAWDETDILTKFTGYYQLDEIQVVSIDGVDAGWLQICETEKEFELAQLHFEKAFQSRGVGSQLIRDLMSEARIKGKSVCLSVVRGNPALLLYRRLGFEVVDEDDQKLHMRWGSNKSLMQPM
jgi:ribosomal protein S18 acetylase RimI-like enzyme